MSTLLIKNGIVVNEGSVKNLDILIKNKLIHKIDKHIITKADRIIDANSNYVLPGAIDAHTHMELPVMETYSSDSFESGSMAALFGGTTTIIDFSNQQKGSSLKEALEYSHSKADNNCYTDYAFHMSVTDVNKKTLEEINHIVKHDGITSFKTFMAYPSMMINSSDMRLLMKKVRELGGLISVHAEDGEMIDLNIKNYKLKKQITPQFHPLSRPDIVEESAVKEIIKIASKEKCPLYIVHLSTQKALNEVIKAKKSGASIYAETCPQYLLLDESLYNNPSMIESAKYILSPPLRSKENHDPLWLAIKDNFIDTVATDHCPFLLKDKIKSVFDYTKIPNGIEGVEHRLELLYHFGVRSKKISIADLVRVTSTNPAKIFGLYPKKGVIKEGSDADLVIFNPHIKQTLSHTTHHSDVDHCPYEGFLIEGKCQTVIIRGRIAMENNKIHISKNFGEYLKR